MAIRVGLDLMSTESVRDAIDVHGRRYLERVYSERELSESDSSAGVDAGRLAERFAAKEAALKVLDVGDEAVSWRDIEVRRQPRGGMTLSLSGHAAALARRAGISGFSLSLTHGRGCAAALVVAEID